jgi:hypothetical protein
MSAPTPFQAICGALLSPARWLYIPEDQSRITASLIRGRRDERAFGSSAPKILQVEVHSIADSSRARSTLLRDHSFKRQSISPRCCDRYASLGSRR